MLRKLIYRVAVRPEYFVTFLRNYADELERLDARPRKAWALVFPFGWGTMVLTVGGTPKELQS